MATARKLPSGNYRVRQYVGEENGKKIYKSFTAPTKKEAEFAAAEFMLTKKDKPISPKMTVGEAIDRYIVTRDPVLSPATIRGYDVIRRCRFCGIMAIPLVSLDNEQIQVAVNIDSATHNPKSVRNAYGLLSATLREYAPDFTPRVKLPPPKKHVIIIPEREDVKNMLQVCSVPQDRKRGRQRDGKLLSVVIMLDAVLGLRRSEICALEWTDIDFECGRVHIQRAIVQNKNGEWVVKGTKSYEGDRILNVPAYLLDAMSSIPQAHNRIVPMTPSALGNRFRRLAKSLSLPEGMHSLRHYNASVMLELGIPDQYAMELMGHATPHMLKTVYQHTMTEGRKQRDTAVEKYFADLVDPENI